jgi:hypothetical protein
MELTFTGKVVTEIFRLQMKLQLRNTFALKLITGDFLSHMINFINMRGRKIKFCF